jgi:hypothetical protein
MPASADFIAAIAFEAERLGDDADGQDAAVARRLGDDRGRTGAGAAAHAGGDEAHMRAFERLFDLLDRLFGRGAADLGPAARAQPLRDLETELDAALGGRGVERLRVGVGDDEIDTLDIGCDHVRDRVAARAADTDHADPRLQLINLRSHEFDRH